VAAVALVALGQARATAPSYRALARDDATRAEAEAVLRAAPARAAVLAPWHWATPMWYLQQVDGLRPDVAVRYIAPQGASLAQNWAEAVAQTLPERPVVVTSFYAAEFAALPYRFVPLPGPAEAWQALSEPLDAAPPGLAGGGVFGDWAFLGYRLEAAGPGPVVVTAAWRTSADPEAIGLFVHLLGPGGALHSQHDVTYGAEQYAGGEVLLGRFALPRRPDAPVGAYTLVAGVYRPGGPRLAETTLATLELPAPPFADLRADLRVPAGAVPLGDAMWLAASRLSPAGPLAPGASVTVRLDFVSAQPLRADYAVGVRLRAADWAWQVTEDGTPAGGALPTLKWIAGSRVTDVRRLVVPVGAAPGTAVVSVVVYDSFTQRPLPVLDFDRRAAGEEVVVGTVEIGAP
jgi:hypothetical protein